MNAPSKSGFAGLLRFALIEVLVVLIGMVFVRREVYMGGHFGEMVLHWQEYALLGLSFIDGLVRGQTRALYSSPFRKRILRYFLPFALFLYVACSSLCDKLNVGCIREEWFRDLGLCIMGGGVTLLIMTQRTRPNALLTAKFVEEPRCTDSAIDSASEDEAGSNVQIQLTCPQSLDTDDKDEPATKAHDDVVEGNSVVEKDPGPETDEERHPSLSGLERQAQAGPGDELAPAKSSDQEADELEPKEVAAKEEIFVSDDVQGPWRHLRYPTRSAILLELIGLSMALAAWMPIFTLPGLIILFKWELADLEAFRISQFGDEYVKYKNKTWFLVPYLY